MGKKCTLMDREFGRSDYDVDDSDVNEENLHDSW